MITILMFLMARQTRKSLESEIRLLRKEIKEKNTLISSLIPSKILESKYCEANNLQISNIRISCIQERETESTASGDALEKNVKEVFVEKTKSLTMQKLQVSITVQNKVVSNRVEKMGDSISINNGGHEDKKMLLF